MSNETVLESNVKEEKFLNIPKEKKGQKSARERHRETISHCEGDRIWQPWKEQISHSDTASHAETRSRENTNIMRKKEKMG